MCGFQGAWSESGFNQEFREKWHGSLGILSHRGPDGFGEFISESLLLNFNRLAILDLSSRAHQPISSRDDSCVLVWNGELYNYVELKREYLDHSFQAAGDTEVAIEMLTRFGMTALELFRGMFAFALWNKKEHVLTLGRDRFGIKPLYWAGRGNGIVFASEIKGLFSLGVSASPNLAAIGRYLRSNRIEEGNETFFKEINRLEPGFLLQFRDGQSAPKSIQWYRFAPPATSFDGSRTEAASELLRVLAESCMIHARSDVGFAVNVSGGVDSSLLVSLSERLSMSHPCMFTVDYPGTRYSERVYVESLMIDNPNRTVSYTDIDEHVLIAKLDEVIRSQDEPFGGIPTLAWYSHFENIRNHGIKVILDGSGLDDLLGGYLKHVIAAYATEAIAMEPETLTDIASEWGLSLEVVTQMFRSFGQEGRSIDGTSGVLSELCRIPVAAPQQFVNESSFVELLVNSFGSSKLYGALRFKDRASMWSGVELRVPFVDHKVAEFCLSLPVEYLIEGGKGKMLLRDVVGNLLPTRLAYAAKRSIQSPQREYMTSGPFADALTESLEHPSDLLLEAIDIPRARSYVRQLQHRPPVNSNPMWQWLNLDRWAKTYF